MQLIGITGLAGYEIRFINLIHVYLYNYIIRYRWTFLPNGNNVIWRNNTRIITPIAMVTLYYRVLYIIIIFFLFDQSRGLKTAQSRLLLLQYKK